MNRRISRGALSFVAFVLLGGVTIAPATSETVKGVWANWALLYIDCDVGFLGSLGTNDLITVEFYGDGKFIGSETRVPGCPGETIYMTETSGNRAYEVDEIQVRAHGDDALFIDRAWYRTDSARDGTGFYKTRYSWGSNDGTGYCVSTDPDDAKTDWSGRVVPDDKCYSCLRLYIGPPDLSFNAIGLPIVGDNERAAGTCDKSP